MITELNCKFYLIEADLYQNNHVTSSYHIGQRPVAKGCCLTIPRHNVKASPPKSFTGKSATWLHMRVTQGP